MTGTNGAAIDRGLKGFAFGGGIGISRLGGPIIVPKWLLYGSRRDGAGGRGLRTAGITKTIPSEGYFRTNVLF
jgi:hypothetical protein